MILTRREVLAAGGALAVTAALARWPAFGAEDDRLANIDPVLRPAAQALLDQARGAPSLEQGYRARRAGPPRHARAPRADIAVRQESVPVPGGSAVTVYVVGARGGAGRPAILHTHGGGYVLGSAKDSIPDLADLAATLGAVIVTVDYTLAPEATWKTSTEQTYAALSWLHAHRDTLGVDGDRIAVMGESAGGGHAALLAQIAHDRGEVPVAFQCLVYPMLDDRTASSRPVPPYIGRVLWTAESNRFGWRSFLGQAPGTAAVPVQAAPARRADLAGLPPAWIGVGAVDLFVEEDVDYARRLVHAGVPTELLVIPGAFHAFDGLAADTAPAKRFTAAKVAALRRALVPA